MQEYAKKYFSMSSTFWGVYARKKHLLKSWNRAEKQHNSIPNLVVTSIYTIGSMHEWVRNKVFLQHIYYLTDVVHLQRNIWIISNQHEKVAMLRCSAVSAVTKLKQH